MALFRNLEKPKGLTRKPIYWDEEKEIREERERRIREELGLDDAQPIEEKERLATYRPNIKGQFRSSTLGNSNDLRQHRKKGLRRMFIAIGILTALLYLMFMALPFLEQFLEKFAQ